jgi:hypothetical protein
MQPCIAMPIVLQQHRYCEIASPSVSTVCHAIASRTSLFPQSSLRHDLLRKCRRDLTRSLQTSKPCRRRDLKTMERCNSRLFGDKTLAVWQCCELLHLCAGLDTVRDLRTMGATLSCIHGSQLSLYTLHTRWKLFANVERKATTLLPPLYSSTSPVYPLHRPACTAKQG